MTDIRNEPQISVQGLDTQETQIIPEPQIIPESMDNHSTIAPVQPQFNQDSQVAPKEINKEPKLPNRLFTDKLDYNSLLKEYTPKEIMDKIQERREIKVELNIPELRKSYSDSDIISRLKQHSEIIDIQEENYKYGEFSNYSDLQRGAKKAATGLFLAYHDVLHLANIEDDEEHKKNAENLQSMARVLENTREDKDFFSAFNLGQIGTEIATLPFGAKTRVASSLLGFVSAYTASRAENTEGQSITAGVAGGALGAGVAHLMRGFNGEDVKKTLRIMEDEHLPTQEMKDEFQKYYKKWSSNVQVENASKQNPTDKVLAMVDFFAEEGAKIKKHFISTDAKAERAILESINDRRKAVKDKLSDISDIDIEKSVNTLEDVKHDVDTNYNLAVDNLKEDKINPHKTKDSFDKVFEPKYISKLSEDNKELVNVISGKLTPDNASGSTLISASDSIEAYELLGKLREKPIFTEFEKGAIDGIRDFSLMDIENSTLKHKYNDLMNAIHDKELVDTYTKDVYHILDKPYDVKELNINSTGIEYSNIETRKKIIKLIKEEEEAGKIERTLFSKKLNGKIDTHTWGNLHGFIEEVKPITEEGKAFKNMIKEFDDIFKIDDYIPRANLTDGLDGTSTLQQATSIAKIVTNFGVFNMIARQIPFSKAAKTAFTANSLKTILRNPVKMKKVMEEVKKIPEGVKDSIVDESLDIAKKSMSNVNTATQKTKLNIKPKGVTSDVIEKSLSSPKISKVLEKLPSNKVNQITGLIYKYFKPNGRFYKHKTLGVINNSKISPSRIKSAIKYESESLATLITRQTGVRVSSLAMAEIMNTVTGDRK